jgi:hypothetical protein
LICSFSITIVFLLLEKGGGGLSRARPERGSYTLDSALAAFSFAGKKQLGWEGWERQLKKPGMAKTLSK